MLGIFSLSISIILNSLTFSNKYFEEFKPNMISDSEILLGECVHLDIPLWHNLRSTLLFIIWKERNCAVYNEKGTSHLHLFMTEARALILQAKRKMTDATERTQTISNLMQTTKWQTWQTQLFKVYSPARLLMIEGIQRVLASHGLSDG